MELVNLLNKVFNLDNIKLMKVIPSNSIDLIYCDILYGTGRNFKGYFEDINSTKKEVFDHYLERIMQMKRILKEDGLLYLQMDYRIHHWMKIICSSIFNIKNIRNEIVWEYNSAPRKKKDFGKRHDIILRISKSDNYYFNDDYARTPYSPTAPRGYKKEKYYNDNGKVLGDVWRIPMLGQNDKTERTGYPTQKPIELLERIILTSSEEGDLIADFYSGSGTTGVVAKKYKRNFILCDTSKQAVKITKKRLNIK